MFGIDSNRSPKVLVVGDVMLDRYTMGVSDRVSPESPVLVVKATSREVRLGGAANVAANCRALGGEVQILGLIGDDFDGRTLLHLLGEQRIQALLVQDDDRCTTVKERILGKASYRTHQHLLRLDCETNTPASASQEEALLDQLHEYWETIDMVLISDYAKGVCTETILSELIAKARVKGVPVFVDPAMGADWDRYRGATLIKPNRREAESVSGISIRTAHDAELAAATLSVKHGIPAIAVTLDRDGMLLFQDGKRCEHFVSEQLDVSDVTGAGDTVFSVLGMAVAQGLDLCDSLRLANLAGGIQVGRQGATTITWDDIQNHSGGGPKEKIVSADWLRGHCRSLRESGKRIVFTNGCFDLLHVGHVTYLQQAAKLGDVLIVATNDDASIRRLKGPTRPLNNELDRAIVLAALECVDFVVCFSEDTPEKLLRELQPDALVKGGDYSRDQVVGHEIVRGYGGEVVVVGAVPGISTTLLAGRAVQLAARGLQLGDDYRQV